MKREMEMNSENEIKNIVKEKYGQIAVQNNESGCGCCCGPQIIDINMVGDEYNSVEGHVEEADLGLGCGIPTQFADIRIGNVVLDLGSGAGNDVFIASKLVGDNGKVIGIDMTKAMIDRANLNKEKLNSKNVEFKLGEIESIPVEDDSIDVVISNCVLNLVPDKRKVFAEIFRSLKQNGHFCISDVVIEGELPEGLKKSAEMYAGCVAGAIRKEEYLRIIAETDFHNIEIVKSKKIELPADLLKKYLSVEEMNNFNNYNYGIFSLTVKGNKK